MATELRDQLQSSLGGSFTLDRELTGGGISRVFVADEAGLGRRVVVKALDPAVAASVSAERFRLAIQSAPALSHPCIVPLLNAGDANGLPYYTMPYVEGESLRERLVRDGAMPVAEVVHVMHDVLSALSHAHGRGVTHGDIKPENIIVTPRHAMVTDFGVARALRESAVEGAQSSDVGRAPAGAPAYLAPEQVLADPTADHRVDLYALGITAYEMLVGEHPFVGRSSREMIAAHAMEVPESVSKHRPGTPSALVSMVMLLLSKDPARRPQSADEVLLEMHRSVTPAGGMPLIGVRLTPPSRKAEPRMSRMFDWALNWRWAIPRHVAAIATACVLMAIAGLLAWRMSGGALVRSERSTLLAIPFDNIGSPSHRYFTDGISDELSGELARLGGIGIIGRATASEYRGTTKTPSEIARELGVTHILSGTVRWDDAPNAINRIRVQSELVRVSDSRQIWSQTYDADMTDIFRVQADIADQVVRNAGGATAGGDAGIGRSPTTNLQAYELYLLGRHLTNTGVEDSVRLAITTYERSIALDSSFALAWSGMASGWRALADTWLPAQEAHPRARAAALQALTLDSTVAGAHLQLAAVNLLHEWNVPEARRRLETALRLNPGSSELRTMRGLRLLLSRSTDSAIAELNGEMARDPHNATTAQWTIHALSAAKRDSEAVAVAQRYVSLSPADARGALLLASAYGGAGDFARMRDAAIAAAPLGPTARAYRGYAEGRLGNRAEALRIARELERSRRWVNPSSVALVHAGLGDANAAMPWLEKAVAERSSDMAFLWLRIWDPIRGDARFKALEQRVGLNR